MRQTTASSKASSRAGRSAGLGSGALFLAQAAFWVLVLFAVVRIGWVQQHLLLPFAGFQGRVACALVGTSPSSVFVGLSCTGADPMALLVGAVLAFPVALSRRLAGVALGLAMILALNIARIGTLSLVVGRRELFQLLHVYVWPAILIVAAAGYVFVWMGRSLDARQPSARNGTGESATGSGGEVVTAFSGPKTARFLALMAVLVILFYLGYRTWMSSSAVLEVARWATVLAGLTMSAFGVAAEVSNNSLRTAQGVWFVGQSCVVTPLLPVYLAAALVLPSTTTRRIVATLAAFPIFLLLGSLRLLVLALPAALVGSHFTAVHAFYQTLAAVVIVVLAARVRQSRVASPAEGANRGAGGGLDARWVRALGALGAGAASGLGVGLLARAWLWPAAERLRDTAHLGHAWVDGQGALALLPAFQIALWVALWLALGRSLREPTFGRGLAILAALQALAIIGLGELAAHAAMPAPVTAIRVLSLAAPIALALWAERSRAMPWVAPEPAPAEQARRG